MKITRPTHSRPGRRPSALHGQGFSIIELLVAIIIITILVTVLIPIIAKRTEEARLTRANQDLENLAENLERVAIDTGYYIRLFALNDVPIGDRNTATGPGVTPPVGEGRGFAREGRDAAPPDFADGLTDYRRGTPLLQDFLQFPTDTPDNRLFLLPGNGDWAPVDQTDLIERLVQNETPFPGTAAWNGPYVRWSDDDNLYNGVTGRTGVPDDPWGNDYLLFTREGLVLEPDGEIVESVSPITGGGLQAGGTFNCLVFDRPTVLSLGPNGLPGDGIDPDGFGSGDDLFRQFGR